MPTVKNISHWQALHSVILPGSSWSCWRRNVPLLSLLSHKKLSQYLQTDRKLSGTWIMTTTCRSTPKYSAWGFELSNTPSATGTKPG